MKVVENVSGATLQDRLSHNIARTVDSNRNFVIYSTDPANFLTPSRLDIIPKLLLAIDILRGSKSDWTKELYLSTINAINGFVEADGSGKIGPNDFICHFQRLIESIKTQGFDPKQPIPTNGTEALDGAHRIAASIALGIEVPVVTLDIKPHRLDFSFLSSRGLNATHLNYIVSEYTRLKRSVRCAIIWPSADGRSDRAVEILKEHFSLISRHTIDLTGRGKVNFIRQVYKGESWLGEPDDVYSGAHDKSRHCFATNRPLEILFLDDLGHPSHLIIEAKARIRSEFGIGNHSIHITDTNEEASLVAQLALNENSLFIINTCVQRSFNWFERLRNDFRNSLREKGVEPEDVCFDGSAALAAAGIRDIRDLDYIAHSSVISTITLEDFDCHNIEWQSGDKCVDDIIQNPNFHFYQDGDKYLSLPQLRHKKFKRGESKDLSDVENIDRILEGKDVVVQKASQISLILKPRQLMGRLKFFALRARYIIARTLKGVRRKI